MVLFTSVSDDCLLSDSQKKLLQAKRKRRRHAQVASKYLKEEQPEEAIPEGLLPPEEQTRAFLWNEQDRDTSVEALRRLSGLPSSHQASIHDDRLALYQYGMEIRHLPLFRYLQTATKFFPTSSWLVARRELKFSKVFDRIAELKLTRLWAPSAIVASTLALRGKKPIEAQLALHSPWDDVLQELGLVHTDIRRERNWKMIIACKVVYEARDAWSKRQKRLEERTLFLDSVLRPPNRPFFYHRQPIERNLAALMESKTPLPVEGAEVDFLSNMASLKHRLSNPPLTPPATPSMHPVCTRLTVLGHEWKEVPIKSKRWSTAELVFVADEQRRKCLDLLAYLVNTHFHSGDLVRSTSDILHAPPPPTNASADEHFLLREEIERTVAKMRLMHGATSKNLVDTRMPTPSTTIKKSSTSKNGTLAETTTSVTSITFNVHPSHESALRKANMNLTKLLTPNELALRRVQKMHGMLAGTTLATGQPPASSRTPHASTPAASDTAQGLAPGQQPAMQSSLIRPPTARPMVMMPYGSPMYTGIVRPIFRQPPPSIAHFGRGTPMMLVRPPHPGAASQAMRPPSSMQSPSLAANVAVNSPQQQQQVRVGVYSRQQHLNTYLTAVNLSAASKESSSSPRKEDGDSVAEKDGSAPTGRKP